MHIFSSAVFEWIFLYDKNWDKQREGSIVEDKKKTFVICSLVSCSIYAISIAVSSEFKPSSASLLSFSLSLSLLLALRIAISSHFFIADTSTLWRIAANIWHKSEMSAAAEAAALLAFEKILNYVLFGLQGEPKCANLKIKVHTICGTQPHTHTNKPTSQCFFFFAAISGKFLESTKNSTLWSFDDDPRLQAPLQNESNELYVTHASQTT